MKQIVLSVTTFFAVLTIGSFAFAQENPQSKNDKAIFEEYAQLGTGVYNIKTDKETGKIQSLLVVGRAPIKSCLGAMRIEHASREASILCAAEFARWCMTIASDEKDNYNKEAQERKVMSSFLENAKTIYWKVDSKNEVYVVIMYLNIKEILNAKRADKNLGGRQNAHRE